jgi:uncharacterized protein YyaL (SSP411 family)
MDEDALAAELEASRGLLAEARRRRPPPLLDDKILAAWNGLAIGALARGAAVLGQARYREAATAAAEFVIDNMLDGGRLARSWHRGRARHDGVLDDYVMLAEGLLDLFAVDSDPRWLAQAVDLMEQVERHFADPTGGYFLTADDGEELLVRQRPDYDGALPSGNSVALGVLVRLETLTDQELYRERAERLLAAFADRLTRAPGAVPAMLSGYEAYEDIAKEIVLVAPTSDSSVEAALDAFRGRLARHYLPNASVVRVTPARRGRLERLVPWVADKPARDQQVTAYVCERRVCKFPTTDPDAFERQLLSVAPYSGL